MNATALAVTAQASSKILCKAIELAGTALLLDPRGALFLPDDGILVVSDLHLEKGSSMARRGYFLPPYDSGMTLARLGEIIGFHRPRAVICLGDSFHDRDAASRLPLIYRQTLTALMHGRNWFWITGNHDPEAPSGLSGESTPLMTIGRLTLRHEPSGAGTMNEIAGHLHPAARMVRRGKSVRRPCFAADLTRLIMPAFGSFTGGLNVCDDAFAGLFCTGSFRAHMLGSDRLYSLSDRQLCDG